jgi:hypothetical protein
MPRRKLAFASTQIQHRLGREIIPETMLLSDFDGNSKLDLLVAAWSSDAVVAFWDKSNMPTPVVSSVPKPFVLVQADFNNDGPQDFAVTSEDGNVRAFLGKYERTFDPGGTFPIGAAPDWMAVGHLNQDSRPDLVVSDSSGGLFLLRGSTTGLFKQPEQITTAGRARHLLVADLDGKDRYDLAVTVAIPQDMGSTSYLQVLLNDGNGSFRALSPILLGPSPVGPPVLGRTWGGAPWLAVPLAGSGVQILRAMGGGAFTRGEFLPGTHAANLAVANFDLDAYDDLAVLSGPVGRNGWVEIFLGDADGKLVSAGNFATGEGLIGMDAFFLLAGEYDGDPDRRPDLLVSNRKTWDITVLLNRSDFE